MKTVLFVVAVLAAPGIRAQPAPTGGDDRVKALAAEGAAQYEAGRFCEAVQTYRKAWRIEPLSELLYNIAYIHDHQLDDPDVARVYYRRYVRARDTDRETRLKAFERLDALDALEERHVGAMAADTVAVPMRAPLAGAPPAAVGTSVTPRGAPDSPVNLRTASWVALGIGAAATLTGATFALLATQSHSKFEDAEDAAARRALGDEGEQRALLGDIGLGVGLAGLATGAVLYLISEDDTRLGATPVPGGAAVGFSGRF